MSYLSETTKGISPVIYHGILVPICEYLATEKNCQVTPEEILENVLNMPADSGISSKLIGNMAKIATIVEGKPKTRAKTNKSGKTCIHIISRGNRIGTPCGARVVEGEDYCNGCLTKGTVKKKLAAQAKAEGASTPGTPSPKMKSGHISTKTGLQSVPKMDNAIILKPWIVPGCAILPSNSYVFKIHIGKNNHKKPLAVGRAEETIIHPFTEEEKAKLVEMGFAIHPSPVTQAIDVAITATQPSEQNPQPTPTTQPALQPTTQPALQPTTLQYASVPQVTPQPIQPTLAQQNSMVSTFPQTPTTNAQISSHPVYAYPAQTAQSLLPNQQAYSSEQPSQMPVPIPVISTGRISSPIRPIAITPQTIPPPANPIFMTPVPQALPV